MRSGERRRSVCRDGMMLGLLSALALAWAYWAHGCGPWPDGAALEARFYVIETERE